MARLRLNLLGLTLTGFVNGSPFHLFKPIKISQHNDSRTKGVFGFLFYFNQHIIRTSILNPLKSSFNRLTMFGFIKLCANDRRILFRMIRHCHLNTGRNIVAVFWDLDNKPPKSVSPFDAAIRLRKAAESFGDVRFKIAYANQRSFDYVPPKIKEHRRDRKKLDELENKGVVKPVDPYICRVCGRKFYNNEKLINHFKQIHEREHAKRVSQIESARGSQRVKLVGKYSMKMEKYRNAARDILTPKVGYGLGDELKRAGYWVSTVSNKPQAADVALRNHIVDMMDKRQMDCLILVSDDSDFVEVLKEAKLRCLRTVAVGDCDDGALKRVADACYSWQDVIMGKAKKEAVSVIGRWKDRDILKRLEWTYNYDRERKLYGSCSEDDDHNSVNDLVYGEDDADVLDGSRAWWKLESDSETASN